jgi:tRNA(fMet)-specific endonuclease VapC
VIIFDTDHAVAVLRGRLDFRARLSPKVDLAVTAITVAELMHGAHKSAQPAENLARVDTFLSAVLVLPFESFAARLFGQLKASLERQGTLASDLDLQIAAIALHHRVPLATHNQKHFARIRGLVLDDWLH